ncbi:MAG: peroxidase [Myxococcales bacterium]|nr:peroxidase [Myxococcales bacterium]
MTASAQQLDQDDIQGLVARGYAKLPSARFFLLQIHDPSLARRYVRRISALVNTVRTSPTDIALQIAFTADGLARLGVPETALATFSREFLEGMAHPLRAPVLGDQGDNDPATWQWGGPAQPRVHILLLLYAADEATLAQRSAAERDVLAANGLAILATKESQRLPDDKEHFGFLDGISAPAFEGLGSGESRPTKQWTAPFKAGEFVLGYRNEYGSYTERPSVVPADDPARILPDVPGAQRRDLGRNGTYLVYRELTQDVLGFWSYLARASREPGDDPTERAIRLGAKMVGRWPSGAPLLTCPAHDDPRHANDNRFGFAGDPTGNRCPLGSHIRRSNPRDQLPVDHSAEDSVTMVRKHQLLRRGRTFGAPLAETMRPADFLAAGASAPAALRDQPRGLHFLCLVGHISRQFELVQSAWISAANFGGLFADGDPLIGARRPAPDDNANDDFTCQAAPVRRKYHGLPQFTRLVGGAYFFLPSITALRFLAGSP